VGKPLVSVLIPCYNAGRFITDTIRSVQQQTHKNLEIIVIDDGSTDDSAAIVSGFPEVKLFRQANGGVPSARNAALRHSSGAFIQYLDADDLLAPQKIEHQLARLTAGNEDCVATCAWGRFHRDPGEAVFEPWATWKDYDALDWLAADRINGLGMMLPAMWLIPRQIALGAGPWNEALRYSPDEDGEYLTRVVLKARRVLFCADARAYYRSGHASQSQGKSVRAFQGQVMVTELCQRHVLAAEPSERMRVGFSKAWQHLAHACYPYAPAIANDALRRARELSDVTIRPSGGLAFKAVSGILGWKMARRLQVWSGRP
jgi:glycosyltransferase involved in cell wall biosynthesis